MSIRQVLGGRPQFAGDVNQRWAKGHLVDGSSMRHLALALNPFDFVREDEPSQGLVAVGQQPLERLDDRLASGDKKRSGGGNAEKVTGVQQELP